MSAHKTSKTFTLKGFWKLLLLLSCGTSPTITIIAILIFLHTSFWFSIQHNGKNGTYNRLLLVKPLFKKWVLCPKTMNFTFFSSAHGTFSRIYHILDHKSRLDKLKKIEIIPKHLFWLQCSKIRCQLQGKKKTIKNTNIQRLNNTLLNNQQITEEIKIYIEMNENENTTTQNLWDTVKAVLRGRFVAIQPYLKKQEKKSNK